VCVFLVKLTLRGQNVPTKREISYILVLVGTFLVPMRKSACKSFSVTLYNKVNQLTTLTLTKNEYHVFSI